VEYGKSNIEIRDQRALNEYHTMKMLGCMIVGLCVTAGLPWNAVAQLNDAGQAGMRVQAPDLPDQDLVTA
jgi:hypothetical protein